MKPTRHKQPFVERRAYLEGQGFRLTCFSPELWEDKYGNDFSPDSAVKVARRRESERTRRKLLKAGFTRSKEGWSAPMSHRLHNLRKPQALMVLELLGRPTYTVFKGR